MARPEERCYLPGDMAARNEARAARDGAAHDLRIAVLASGIAAAFLLHVRHLACVAEDAFISFRFARHLVEGHGLVWNLGEAPVEGYTNFLWMLLSAGLLGAGLDVARGSQLLGTAAGLATLAYAWALAARGLRLGPGLGLVAPALLAVSGPFATWAGSGLETHLFTLWVTAGVHHLLAFHRDERARSAALFAGVMLLAMLTRPEGVMVYGLLLGAGGLLFAARPRLALARSALPVGLSLAVFALYFAVRWSYFGHPLPNTFYAKTEASAAQARRGLQYVLWFAATFGAPLVPLGLAWLGTRLRGRGPGLAPEARGPLGVCLLLLGVYAVYVAAVGGDYMAMYRFLVPVLPVLYAAVAWMLADGLARLPAASPWGPAWARVGAAGLLAVAALGTGIHSTPFERRLFPKPPFMHGTWRGVQFERWSVDRLSQIGRYFAKQHRPGESLATGAIGAVSFYSGMTVYGRHGLVDPEIAHRPSPEALGEGFPGHERDALLVLLGKAPTYVMLGPPRLTPEPVREWPYVPDAARPLLERDYELVSVWVGEEGTAPAGWFRVFRRRAP